jgi:CheY-like chemotaxis protein
MNPPLILLVDDAPELGLIVRRLADRCGWAADYRPDAASSLAFLRSTLPDLLLVDVNLAGESGPDLCRCVRADPNLAGLAVAVFAHEGLADDVAAGLEAGADFVVSKDLVVSPEAWAVRLGEILKAVNSRASDSSLRSPTDEAPVAVPSGWVGVLNGALGPPTLRGFEPPVVRALLRRALSKAFTPQDADRYLTPDGCQLDPARLSAVAGRDAAALAAVIAEQVWCVAGGARQAAFRAALGAVFARLPEPLTSR